MSEALPHLAENVRRLMAREGLTIAKLVDRSGLDERTIKGLLAGTNDKPHARTLHHLAKGLAAETDELFDNPVRLALRRFDRNRSSASARSQRGMADNIAMRGVEGASAAATVRSLWLPRFRRWRAQVDVLAYVAHGSPLGKRLRRELPMSVARRVPGP